MSSEASIQDEVTRMREYIEKVRVEKRKRLRNLDFFCLDNSLRESTVGQLRSHTLENKKKIWQEIKKAGITDIIAASFSHMTRVDDDFAQWLNDEGEDLSRIYSFSEVSEGIKDGACNTEAIPNSLKKNLKYNYANTFFEVDMATDDIKWEDKFTTDDMCQLIYKWIKWVHENHPGTKPRNLLNIRDFPLAMIKAPERVLTIVTFLAQLPDEHKLFALAFEDPLGEYLPEELEGWVSAIRRTMDKNGWSKGRLLNHIHQKWDLQTAATLDCLTSGSDGVWASLCEEGAALGHASSTVTMLNLLRMGNKKLLKKYNCSYFREAAINITKLTTGLGPHPKQPVYNIAEFFGVEAPIRITTVATTQMITDKLVNLFGENEQFTQEIATAMKEKMLEDLRNGQKQEYMSKVGFAVLFDRKGGKLTPNMADEIANSELALPRHEEIIAEIRELWDHFDANDEGKSDDALTFDAFFHGFMVPYFGCYRCPDTQKAFQAIDMDSDNLVDWNEFLVYVKWALMEYPDIKSADETLEIAFEKGLIPAMRDEKLQNRDAYTSSSYRFNQYDHEDTDESGDESGDENKMDI